MAARCSWGWLLVVAVLGFLQASSTFEVTEHGKICILANFSAQFTVEYSTKVKTENKTFMLPNNAEVLKNSSTCGKQNSTSPIIVIGFGPGHSLSMTFEEKKGFYDVDTLTFIYNLSDTSLFPNSTGGIKHVTSKTDIQASLNTTYKCTSNNRIHMEAVIILLSNVTLEAYLANNYFSPNETVCAEDKGSTTVAPTTTHPPTTTSQAPPTPSATPEVGKYNVTGLNGVCLLASLGLQLNVTYPTKDKQGTIKSDVLNLPSNASSSGICDNSSITWNLTSEKTALSFHFIQNTTTEKYFLQGIYVSTVLPAEAVEQKFHVGNSSLSALKATVGKSYKCFAEESILVAQNAHVNVFNVQIQAFKIEGGNFGAVEECQLDENNMLIPIIVGAALAGLVLIVLIAYLIGRKRSHAGYQTI